MIEYLNPNNREATIIITLKEIKLLNIEEATKNKIPKRYDITMNITDIVMVIIFNFSVKSLLPIELIACEKTEKGQNIQLIQTKIIKGMLGNHFSVNRTVTNGLATTDIPIMAGQIKKILT